NPAGEALRRQVARPRVVILAQRSQRSRGRREGSGRARVKAGFGYEALTSLLCVLCSSASSGKKWAFQGFSLIARILLVPPFRPLSLSPCPSLHPPCLRGEIRR